MTLRTGRGAVGRGRQLEHAETYVIAKTGLKYDFFCSCAISDIYQKALNKQTFS